MHRPPRTVTIGVVLASLSVAGCGESEFTRKANDICEKYSARFKALPFPTGESQVGGYLDKVAPVLAEGTAKLKALRPPSDTTSAYRELLSTLGREVAVAREAAQIAKAGNAKQAVALIEQESGLIKEVDAKAHAAGLKDCQGGLA